MQWTSDLQIAVIENNFSRIGELIKAVPEFVNLEEAQEALALIQEAIKIIDSEKEKTIEIMDKIKKTKAFLQNQ